MTVCLVFSIIALILSLVSSVCGVLALFVADTEEKKKTFYTIAGGFMSFVGMFLMFQDYSSDVFVEFNDPVNTIKIMSSRSVYLTTLFLGRLSPLSD